MSVKPFKLDISDAELNQLSKKLALTRLPISLRDAQWPETNGVTVQKMAEILSHWRNAYSWRDEEAKINASLPQYTTSISVKDFGQLNIHFVHSKASNSNSKLTIPLLFIHGWPGSFIEVLKILPVLNEKGFDVVAPSLPGYGFSSYPDKAGFKHDHHAEVFHKLMYDVLGYKNGYVVQGGDWGHYIARCVGILYPEHCRAVHLNMFVMPEPPDLISKVEYTPFERVLLERADWFYNTQCAYGMIQSTKPLTLAIALHDSPLGMLAWMADKLFCWTDEYPWTPTEIITWTLLHYFPGPATGFDMYRQQPGNECLEDGLAAREYCNVPTAVSAFPKELEVRPASWCKKRVNLAQWVGHEDGGGHFAAWERPNVLAEEMVEFYRGLWQ